MMIKMIINNKKLDLKQELHYKKFNKHKIL